MRRRKQKRRKKNIERIRRELEKEGIRVENNPDTLLIVWGISSLSSDISSEINSLSDKISSRINSFSNKVVCFGLAIIAIIAAFGLALMSAL